MDNVTLACLLVLLLGTIGFVYSWFSYWYEDRKSGSRGHKSHG